MTGTPTASPTSVTAATIAAADDVRVVLVEPSEDPAAASGAPEEGGEP